MTNLYWDTTPTLNGRFEIKRSVGRYVAKRSFFRLWSNESVRHTKSLSLRDKFFFCIQRTTDWNDFYRIIIQQNWKFVTFIIIRIYPNVKRNSRIGGQNWSRLANSSLFEWKETAWWTIVILQTLAVDILLADVFFLDCRSSRKSASTRE